MKQRLEQKEDFLESLTDLFYPALNSLATFELCQESELPVVYRGLLAHHSHMTVTVERRHGCAVDVQVIRKIRDEQHYSREILLRRQSDRRVVQYGIVRLTTGALANDVLHEIFSEAIPLGRVLIQHGVLTQVQLLALWQVLPSRTLADLMEMPLGMTTYGRTALIYCDGEPAIELLEIVVAEETFANVSALANG